MFSPAATSSPTMSAARIRLRWFRKKAAMVLCRSQIFCDRGGVGHEVAHGAVLYASTVVDDVVTVGDLRRHAEILLDEQHGRFGGELPYRLHHLLDNNRREPFAGL